MNIHHTTKTTLLAFLGFMCLTTELEAKFNPLRYINPSKIMIGATLAALFRLHSKESAANFTEIRADRYEKASFYMKPLCYIDDWIIGQRESSNLLKVTDKNYIKFSCKESADAAGFFGIFESFIEPYGDAAKNLLFIVAAFQILLTQDKSIFSHKEITRLLRIIEEKLDMNNDFNCNTEPSYPNRRTSFINTL